MKRALLVALSLLLSSCEVGPDYHRPAAIGSAGYKELAGWKPGTPMDTINRGAWWSIYRDPVLDGLERQVAISNQNLAAAQAAYEQAQALVQEARANFWPQLTLGTGATRQSIGRSTRTIYNIQGGATWEPDLWGRIRRTVEGTVASAQALAADVSSAKLSAEATLATAYFNLRASDSLARLLSDTVEQFRRALQITENQYAAGVAARFDVITAQTQLETVQAQLIAVGVQRAQFEHAIAVLTGRPPSALTIPAGALPSRVPIVPVGVPSALLERRPDVAAAERIMKQQNAQIGVQVAAFFPTVTLSANYGYSGGPLGSLISVANRVWSLGASASETLFAGGARTAAVAAARAFYDQSIANYRQVVLTAFQQVEDQLAALRILEQQAAAEAVAVRSAQQAVTIALNEYRAGTAAYTAVITAQTTALNDEVILLQIQQSRLIASVALIEALGGGWDTSRLPSKGELQHWNPILPSGPIMQPLRNP